MRSLKISLIAVMLVLAGCSSSAINVGSLVLPTSNKTIDVVQHRSDVKALDCTTLTVLQTYDASGVLIDAKSAQGRALHCDAAVAVIDAGAAIGAANQIRRGLAASASEINNVNAQAQGQEQGQFQSQLQGQGQSSTNVNTNVNSNRNSNKNTNSNSNTNSTKVKVPEATTNEGHGHGNNGYGNGGHDGSPNGKPDRDR